MAGHRQDFDPELEAIEAKVIELFAMVAEGLPSATRALVTGNNKLLKVLAARHQVVDALYAEIEKLASREILAGAGRVGAVVPAVGAADRARPRTRLPFCCRNRRPGQPHPRRGSVAAQPGAGRAGTAPPGRHFASRRLDERR
jgi:hypothetical protein